MDEPRRILHVEDDEDILEIARLSLETIGGFELMQCASGPEAVQKAEAFLPDLFLLDFMMPEMNGFVTLQELRKIAGMAHIPAIFMTAKDLSLEDNPEISAAVIGRIRKPFDPIALPDEIRRIWRGAQPA